MWEHTQTHTAANCVHHCTHTSWKTLFRKACPNISWTTDALELAKHPLPILLLLFPYPAHQKHAHRRREGKHIAIQPRRNHSTSLLGNASFAHLLADAGTSHMCGGGACGGLAHLAANVCTPCVCGSGPDSLGRGDHLLFRRGGGDGSRGGCDALEDVFCRRLIGERTLILWVRVHGDVVSRSHFRWRNGNIQVCPIVKCGPMEIT